MFARCLINFPCDHQPRLEGRFENQRVILQARSINEILPLLAEIENHSKLGRWAVGMMAYEAAPAFDPAFKTHSSCPDFPLAAFGVFDAPPTALPAKSTKDFSCSVWESDTSRSTFENKIERIRTEIAAGNYYQTNFTTRLNADFEGDGEALFHALSEAQPDSYAAFLDFGEWQIASVSPELFFAWNPETRLLTTRPMKGTASLLNSAEDLKKSIKDRAENLMIVDLLRNDISRVADKVEVPELFAVQNLTTIRQMTSTITGTTRPHISLPEIFKALFPCGSITGAPKIAAMAAIAGHETSPRGAYCGAIGIVQPNGEALFSVGIRTVTIANNKATCGIGSGITWDSKPAEEYSECQIKQRFLWRATASFDLLETIRLENSSYWLLEKHLARLQKSAEHFGFIYEANSIQDTLFKLARQNPAGVFRVRLLVERLGKIKADISPLASFRRKPESSVSSNKHEESLSLRIMNLDSGFRRNDAVVVQLADFAIDSSDEFLRHKTTHRAVYEKHTPKDPAIFDTLLYSERDEITEFTRGNVAVELDGKIVTPPESCGLLPGTLRAELLSQGKMTEQIIKRDDLNRATAIWFFNGLRGMIAVKFQQDNLAIEKNG